MLLLLPLAAESAPEAIARGSSVVHAGVAVQDIKVCAGCGMQIERSQVVTIKIVDLVFQNVCRSAREDTLNSDKVCRIHPFVGLRHVGLQHNFRLRAWNA